MDITVPDFALTINQIHNLNIKNGTMYVSKMAFSDSGVPNLFNSFNTVVKTDSRVSYVNLG